LVDVTKLQRNPYKSFCVTAGHKSQFSITARTVVAFKLRNKPMTTKVLEERFSTAPFRQLRNFSTDFDETFN